MDFSLTEAQQRWQAVARAFARDEVAPRAREADETRHFDRDLVTRMGALGLLGALVPAEYGGSAMDALSYVLVSEELGWADSSARGFLTVHAGLVSRFIAEWATPAQKAEYLPRLTSGEWIGCYCLTEAEAGSDAASIRTTATRDGDDWTLYGEKIWITNGNVADLAIVMATRDPTERHKSICAFLVPTSAPGIIRTPMPGVELGHRASDHAHITLDNVRVPSAQMLGEPGHGFKMAMSALDRGRLGVAAGAVGVGQACLDACVSFARQRRQFGQRIGDFQMIQATIADMAADVQAARMLVYQAAWALDQGQSVTRATSIAKLFATEAAARAAGEAVLLHGNRGYSSEYPVERYYRDIKGLQIYEGTSHIQRVIIARDLLGREREQ